MFRRVSLVALIASTIVFVGCFTNKKVNNPIANVNSKQPDKVLYDRAMDAMKHNKFDVARLSLQTLINTYPDSEYIARAKLAVGDSWYAEGGTAALAQAEQEYSDFEIFFPNMSEAAEAQLKIANIHYQQMEKADRDPTHARRAEDEYRKVILQYPDSKLVPEAKRKLLEVQEVLADREFGVGKFYYMRESYAASIARLQSMVEKYPLYSRADEAYYLLGQNYEGQIPRIRALPTCDAHFMPRGCMTEKAKANGIEILSKHASDQYSKILTRYPLMDRADDARKRLAALHQPIPRPTKAAVAQNKAEIASRGEKTVFAQMKGLIQKGPDVSQAPTVGEPTLVETEPVAPSHVAQQEFAASGSGEKTLGVTIINPDQPASDNAPPIANPLAPPGSPLANPSNAGTPAPDPNELKPISPADPNELKPADSGTDTSLPPPTQVNEIQGQSSSAAMKTDNSAPASDQDLSSSKKKKKKGLSKINPF